MDGNTGWKRAGWFTGGAALTLTAGLAFSAFVAGAAPGDDDTTFVPITACRLADTRPAPFNVGPRATPIGSDDTYVVAAHGDEGNCSIPAEAGGLTVNVTAVGATMPTFLTLWDEGTLPVVSSLNPVPGDPPTPNAVSVPLTAAGTFNIYNFQGDVDVIVDVTGYHTGSSLAGLAADVAKLQTDLASANRAISNLDRDQAFVEYTQGPSSVTFGGGEEIVAVTIDAPAAGRVMAVASGTIRNLSEGDHPRCALHDVVGSPSFAATTWSDFMTTAEAREHLTLARTFEVQGGDSLEIFLVCEVLLGDDADVLSPQIMAIFTPT